MAGAGGGVATALFIVPRAHNVVQAISAGSVYRPSDPTESDIIEIEGPELEPPTEDDESEPEIPVGDPKDPPPVDPDEQAERMVAKEPPASGPIPPNPPIEFDAVEIDVVEGERPWVVHRLTPFETIDQVAYRYDVSPSSLRGWNGLPEGQHEAKPGLRLKLKATRIPPPRTQVKYTVQSGDTWWSIAAAHAIDSKELRAANWNASRPLTVADTLDLWIDPVVYHWVQTDRPRLDDESLLANIRRGAVGVGTPWDGRVINGVQIPDGKGWHRTMVPSSYGTTHAVMNLIAALQEFRASSGYERDLLLGSMSRRHGGPLTGYRSHQSGRDIDIRLPLLKEHPAWFPIKAWRIDWAALWSLVVALADTGEVSIIFLDYDLQKMLHQRAVKLGVDESVRRRLIQWPRGQVAQRGVVRHSRGHDTHLHVRFRCGPLETECVSGHAG